jgi:hypothetical protein
LRPCERIVDVGHEADLRRRKPRIEAGGVHARERCKPRRRRRDGLRVAVKIDAERVQRSAAAVVGAAPAQADHEPAHACVEQMNDELADAARRALGHRSAHRGGIGDPHHLRDLDHGGHAIGA